LVAGMMPSGIVLRLAIPPEPITPNPTFIRYSPSVTEKPFAIVLFYTVHFLAAVIIASTFSADVFSVIPSEVQNMYAPTSLFRSNIFVVIS
jgi:hypothetical protein